MKEPGCAGTRPRRRRPEPPGTGVRAAAISPVERTAASRSPLFHDASGATLATITLARANGVFGRRPAESHVTGAPAPPGHRAAEPFFIIDKKVRTPSGGTRSPDRRARATADVERRVEKGMSRTHRQPSSPSRSTGAMRASGSTRRRSFGGAGNPGPGDAAGLRARAPGGHRPSARGGTAMHTKTDLRELSKHDSLII